MIIKRDFITVNNGQHLHYRRSGNGLPLIMLHPSPQCSETLIPAMEIFSANYDCLALDTPGYGLSEKLDLPEPDISDYAKAIIEAIDALGCEKFCLYGSATGGQIAIEIAKQIGERIHLLLLDTNGHMSEDDIKRILKGYLPDVTPKRDGGHLLTYWDMCRHLYVSFPWYSALEKDRIHIDLPDALAIHTLLLRYLRAGNDYWKAYRAAFLTENISHMSGLTIPTTVLRWQGSIILPVTDALINQGLSDNIEILHAGPTLDERYTVQLEALNRHCRNLPPVDLNIERTNEISGLENTFIKHQDQDIYVRLSKQGHGRPIVLLHNISAAGNELLDLAQPAIGKRPLAIIDLPGHGESTTNGDLTSIKEIAKTTAAAIEQLNFDDFDIVAFGSGGSVGVELIKTLDVHSAFLIDPIGYTDEEKSAFKENGLPIFLPKIDGSHLISIWSMIRDEDHYWPWLNHTKKGIRKRQANLDPDYLHRRAVNVIKLGGRYRELKTLELNYDWQESMQGYHAQITLAFSPNYPAKNAVYENIKSRFQSVELTSVRKNWLKELLNV